MTTKYPIKVGQKLYPAGTEVHSATLDEMQCIWPGIQMRLDSPQAGVWFPGMEVPTIVHTSQLEGVRRPIPTWTVPASGAAQRGFSTATRHCCT